MSKSLDIIGSTTSVTIEGVKNIPAKIDTGAESSAIWVSDIDITRDGILEFKMFAPGSPYYTGRTCRLVDYHAVIVRSSVGGAEIRYRTNFKLHLGNRDIRAMFTLADRSKNRFPILIGRRTLRNKFLVYVSKTPISNELAKSAHADLLREFDFDPFTFHEKYVKNKAPIK
jgi:hypothetical protein